MDVDKLVPGESPFQADKNYDVLLSGFLPTWNQQFFGKSCTVYVYSMYSFYAVVEERYTAKKKQVDLSGCVPDGDDELDEMYRIIGNVIKSEKMDAITEQLLKATVNDDDYTTTNNEQDDN